MYKVNTNDELSKDACTKILKNIIVLNVNVFFMESPMRDDMMTIHQISKIGGDLLNPKVEYFGLSGFFPSTVPIRFCSRYILAISEVNAPSWATINSITTTE